MYFGLRLVAFICLLTPVATAEERKVTEHVLGAGVTYETPYVVLGERHTGPAVLIQACIHGDEAGGVPAVDKLASELSVDAGYVILLPRMNAPACKAHKRFINVDLNRVFGAAEAEARKNLFYEYRLADEISRLVGASNAEFVLTLHESHERHDPIHKRHFGQTICYGVKPKPKYLDAWIDRLNKAAPDPSQHFTPYYAPIAGSSTEVLVAKHRLKGGFCVEVLRSFSPRVQADLHTRAILTFLDTVGVKYRLSR